MPIVTDSSVCEPISIAMLHERDWSETYRSLLDTSCYTPHGTTMGTIGHPLYLASTAEQYYSDAARSNTWFYQRFGSLLDAFIESLESALGIAIRFHPRLALPGFHRFSMESGSSYRGGVWHTDKFDFEILPSAASRYSATLLLGDNFISYGIDYQRGETVVFFPHQIGCITLFPSDLPHRIADCGVAVKKMDRLTLQAHIWVYQQYAIAFW